MRAAIYSRKSVYSDKSESTENQIALCRAYLAERYPDAKVEIYEDNGFSAKNTDRPQFQKMLRGIENGEIDLVICYRLDRISRSVSDFTGLIDFFMRKNVIFLCVREQFDTSTPMGKAMMYISSVFAQLERETIAERVRDNMIQLARSGRRMGGSPPTGYELIRNAEGKMLLRAEESDRVRMCFSVFLKERSLEKTAQIAGKLTAYGLRGILRNPVYCAMEWEAYRYFRQQGYELNLSLEELRADCGFLAYNRRGEGKTILAAGTHPALIPARDFILTQLFLEIVSVQNDYAALSGLLICAECGNKMSAQKYRKGYRYRCKVCGRSFRGESADEVIESLLKRNGIHAKNIWEKRIYVRILLKSALWNGKNLFLHLRKVCTETASGNDRCTEPESL